MSHGRGEKGGKGCGWEDGEEGGGWMPCGRGEKGGKGEGRCHMGEVRREGKGGGEEGKEDEKGRRREKMRKGGVTLVKLHPPLTSS